MAGESGHVQFSAFFQGTVCFGIKTLSVCLSDLSQLVGRFSFTISSSCSKFGIATNLPRLRDPRFNVLEKLLRLLQRLHTALVWLFLDMRALHNSPQSDHPCRGVCSAPSSPVYPPSYQAPGTALSGRTSIREACRGRVVEVW